MTFRRMDEVIGILLKEMLHNDTNSKQVLESAQSSNDRLVKARHTLLASIIHVQAALDSVLMDTTNYPLFNEAIAEMHQSVLRYGPHRDLGHSIRVLDGEVTELKTELYESIKDVRRNRPPVDRRAVIRAEAIQVAAVALLIAEKWGTPE